MKKKAVKSKKAKVMLKGGLKDLPAKSKRAAAVRGGSNMGFKIVIPPG